MRRELKDRPARHFCAVCLVGFNGDEILATSDSMSHTTCDYLAYSSPPKLVQRIQNFFGQKQS